MNKKNIFKLSDIEKTWIIDIDGVIFEHNKYKTLKKGQTEKCLPGVKSFFKRIPQEDFIILLTGRDKTYKNLTEKSLRNEGIRYDLLIMGLPKGERILINDEKPDGLKTAYAINLKRDEGLKNVKWIKAYKKKM
jgi:uncharacterized HAD superfamily protein